MLSILALVIASSTVYAETIFDCANAGNNSCSDTVKRVGGLDDGQEPIDVCVEQCKLAKNSIQSVLNSDNANGKVWSCSVDSVTVTGTREDERYGGTLVYCDCDINCKAIGDADAEPVDPVEPQRF